MRGYITDRNLVECFRDRPLFPSPQLDVMSITFFQANSPPRP
jgi:hypothetical protein